MARTPPIETAGSSDPPRGSRFALKDIGKYAPVALDAAAAAFSIAPAQLSDPRSIKVTATLTGSLWTSAAIIREGWYNSSRSMVVSSTNFLGGVAGVLATAAPHLAGENRKGIRYASAAVSAVNGAANLVHAIGKGDATIANRVLTGASGLATAAGAALSAASVNAAAENKSADAVKLATASGAMWLAGAAADAAAAWADRRRPKFLDSEQAPAIERIAVDPAGHDSEHHVEHEDIDPGLGNNAPEQKSSHGLHHVKADYSVDATGHLIPTSEARHPSLDPVSSLPKVSAAAGDVPSHGLRHLKTDYSVDATGHVIARSEAHHPSLDPVSSLPNVSANASREVPPQGPHRLRGLDKLDDGNERAVEPNANASNHDSGHLQNVAGTDANKVASATENTRNANYNQRQRNVRDGLER